MNEKIQSILFIGNSITLHGYASYWWSDKRGMASSSIDNDYVHRVVNYLKKGTDIKYEVMNFYLWEIQAMDRAETLQLLDGPIEKMSGMADMVIIQLGENIVDCTTLEEDFEELIDYLRKKIHCKELMIIGDFWKNDDHDEIKKKVCLAKQVKYIDLQEIQNSDEYKAGIGTSVDGDDGKKHVIEHNGVSRHPGDKGMKYIADQILDAI